MASRLSASSAAPDLRVLALDDSAERVFERAIMAYAEQREAPPRILEAGCGRAWPLDLGELRFTLVGVDTDAESLRLRQSTVGDLAEAIHSDLRTVDLPSGSFDVVYCAYVLEHVHGAEEIMDRLVALLRPGGLLMLRVPDRDSVYGFITRVTPHSVHVQYKRRIRGRVNAGKPGYGPFPTVYDPVITRAGIRRFCLDRGLNVREEFGSNFHLRFFGRRAPLVDRLLRAVAALSFGRLTATHNNLGYIIEK